MEFESDATESQKRSLSAAAAAVPDQICTPEKPAGLPRRARNRSVALSVKEVRRAALGLRLAEKALAAPPAEVELDGVERQLGVGASADQIRSSTKSKPQSKLPDKYEMLCEFFNCMESSIRLLHLKGSKTTFPNICTSIQHLSERRFTYAHLAQLKYILPEAVVVKKVLLHDERTCCMRPDLQVNLQVEGIGNDAKKKGECGYSVLRRIFRQRVVDFFRDHPEADDVPEDELPHPFGRSKPSVPLAAPRVLTNSINVDSSSNASPQQQSVVMSHMSQSFQRRFSQKAKISSSSDRSLRCTSSALAKGVSSAPSPIESSPKPPVHRKSLLSSPISRSPIVISEKCVELDVLEGTPAKLASTPIRLMAATPNIQTPKRPLANASYDTTPLKKMTKRSARTKLFTTPTKSARSTEEGNRNRSLSANDDNDDVLSFLPKSLLQSVKERERRALEEKESGFANEVRRQKLITGLPGTFDIILLICQSTQRSVMRKQELIHKIIESSRKIVDRGEVEEHLKLFQELVPDWISEKMGSTGDTLCCIDMTSSPKEIRQRLCDA